MATYYAKIRIDGKGMSVPVKVMASTITQAKKMIEAQYGSKISFVVGPQREVGGKPPPWFK